jgi:uncharacterized membrane protein
LWQITRVIRGATCHLTVVLFAATLWLVLGGACSGSTATECPDDYPATCPDGAATFATDVAPLMQVRCTICHAGGQQVPTLQTYGEISAAAPHVLTQLRDCAMPPAPRPPLTTDERRVLLSWLACGALDN